MQSSRQSYQDVVIVGSGPVGLYLAIKLKEAGVNVTVVDFRVGEFTRPGVLDQKVFDNISLRLKKEIVPSSSRHIKDVQRELYTIAMKAGVRFQESRFTSFIKGGMEVMQDKTKQYRRG